MTKNIVIMGAQGAGKGTQSKLLAARLGLFHLEMGHMLRKIAKQPTDIGHKVDEIINKKGGLVPYEMVVELTKNTVANIPKDQGIVFDGTPRRQQEIEPFHRILRENDRTLTHVFFIEISEQEAIKRLSNRRMCQTCHQLVTAVEKTSGRQTSDGGACAKCGGVLIQREDDKPEAIKKRLGWYKEQTGPVLAFYREKNMLITISGEQPVEEVYRDITKHV